VEPSSIGVLIAALGALGSLAGGAWALRAILKNKLITLASHNEHIAQWQAQVEGLRQRLTEQDAQHQRERDRANTVAESRILDAKAAADARVSDRDQQIDDLRADRDYRIGELARQNAQLWSAFTLTDEAYKQITGARLATQNNALRTVAHVLSASPLADELPPTVGSDGNTTG
jgi:chromosome segregation ATPase